MNGLISLKDGECYLEDYFLTQTYAEHLLNALTEHVNWSQPEIILFGKKTISPRLAAWYGDEGVSYTYSGLRNEPLPWIPELSDLKQKVTEHTECEFNSVLLNLYRDGEDCMSWHSDNEEELGARPVIASISLGASRRFLLKHRFDKQQPTVKLDLIHGSLLVMCGNTQEYWRHRIPRTKTPIGPRINLTFRQVYHS